MILLYDIIFFPESLLWDDHFCIIFGSDLYHFGIIVGSVFDNFEILLSSFWIILGSFWYHFGESFWDRVGVAL